jgi:hypothetical protein
MSGDLPLCPQCHARIDRKAIRVSSFCCPTCGEYLSISQGWSERQWWAGVGLSLGIFLILRPNPWLAGLLFFPVALIIAIGLSIALAMFHRPPKLERSIRPGSFLGLHK